MCSMELRLVEDVVFYEFDGDLLKDVEHYFECPNSCDSEVLDLLDDEDDEIMRIIEGYVVKN